MSLSRDSVYLTIASSGEVSNVDKNGRSIFPHMSSTFAEIYSYNLAIGCNLNPIAMHYCLKISSAVRHNLNWSKTNVLLWCYKRIDGWC